MSTTPANLDPEQILERIDSINRGLQTLRQQVIELPRVNVSSSTSTTEELFGAAWQGSWDEWNPNLDWLRFSE